MSESSFFLQGLLNPIFDPVKLPPESPNSRLLSGFMPPAAVLNHRLGGGNHSPKFTMEKNWVWVDVLEIWPMLGSIVSI